MMQNDSDRMLDQNLSALGAGMETPAGPSQELRSACHAALGSQSTGVTVAQRPRRLGTIWSSLAVAASVVLVAGLFLQWGSAPKVEAATILAKLDKQMEQPTQIEVTLDSIAVDEVEVSAHLQVGEEGIAGDVQAKIDDGDGFIEVDVALGIGPESAWVLVRKLSIPDEDVQPILAMILPEGTETLLMLPEEIAQEEIGADLSDAVSELKDVSRFVHALTDLAEQQADSVAEVTQQGDGTLLLTVPITDADALEDFIRLVAEVAQAQDGDVDPSDIKFEDGELDEDAEGLFGSTLEIVYDPDLELVKSFSLTGFGEQNGSISVALSNDPISADLLDYNRVTGPTTRTLDLSALKAMASMFENHGGEED